MIGKHERARRDGAHVDATAAWHAIERKSFGLPRSPTAGLGEMIRSIGASRRVPAEVRAHRQKMHKARLRAAHAKALASARVFDSRTLDRSRYFPHQSDREKARRVRRYQSATA